LGKGEDPLLALQQTARNLEKAGADFIIIPCNTAHYFLPSIQESVKIPILNMIEETAEETQKRIPQIQKVGLLASMGVYETRIYHQQFKKYNIEVISPEEKDKEEVMKAIYAVKAGDLSNEVKGNIIKIAQKLIDKEAEVIIAGCTEIPLILKEGDVSVPIIDPTQILAEAAVQKAKP
jgi:aspartate racemase